MSFQSPLFNGLQSASSSSKGSLIPTTGSLFSGSSLTGQGLFSGIGNNAASSSAASSTTTPSTTTPASITSTPSTTSASTTTDQNISTDGIKYTPQALPGGTYKCTTIMADPKFKNYTPLELRVYDYVKKNKIEKLPPQPEKPKEAAPAAQPLSLFSKTTGTDNTNNNNKTFGFGAVQDHGEGLKINWQKATYPTEIAYKVESAAPYFQPIPKITIESRQHGYSGTSEQQIVRHKNYSKLFQPRTSTHIKQSVVPLVVPSKMYSLAEPAPSCLDQFRLDAPQELENKYLTTVPSLKEIGDTKKVAHFRIERQEFGAIDFQNTIDISGFDFRKDVVINERFVDVYRRKRDIPEVGTGLNTDAIITLYKVFPKDKRSGKRYKTDDLNIVNGYQSQLKEYCLSKNIRFISYHPSGVLQFAVSCFNRGPFEFP
ncbi:nuclear pore complex protein [Histomonas meleagridis]|uniref:nuclear pore complex protein Nup98-Nup96 n=1 Tax=Histomonas meleagridis TaxID=135588 RepID=UPI00355983E2|nr:nuclear pore complex protein [Histomonas meleagridis]KAH0806198.1 nuclear pore complex protein Nup98-Nup96 [Histomonas meleagridis]